VINGRPGRLSSTGEDGSGVRGSAASADPPGTQPAGRHGGGRDTDPQLPDPVNDYQWVW